MHSRFQLASIAAPARSTRWLAPAAAAAIAACLAPSLANAQSLSLSTQEYGPWPAAVAALQTDVGAEGRSVQVRVQDDRGATVPCGTYTLTLDPVASRAFEVGACDVATGDTAVRLVNRSALFAHDEEIPRPLMAGITAVRVETGGASGGAGQSGGADAECTLSLHPYLMDLEHGERVALRPGRYVLEPLSSDIDVANGTDGWTLHGRTRATVSVAYRVVDTRTGAVVVRDSATLSCAQGQSDNTAPAPAPDPQPVVVPAPDPQPVAAPTRPSDPAQSARSLHHLGIGFIAMGGVTAAATSLALLVVSSEHGFASDAYNTDVEFGFSNPQEDAAYRDATRSYNNTMAAGGLILGASVLSIVAGAVTYGVGSHEGLRADAGSTRHFAQLESVGAAPTADGRGAVVGATLRF